MLVADDLRDLTIRAGIPDKSGADHPAIVERVDWLVSMITGYLHGVAAVVGAVDHSVACIESVCRPPQCRVLGLRRRMPSATLTETTQ